MNRHLRTVGAQGAVTTLGSLDMLTRRLAASIGEARATAERCIVLDQAVTALGSRLNAASRYRQPA